MDIIKEESKDTLVKHQDGLPSPKEICKAIAKAALNKNKAHLYGPILGNTNLRIELSEKWKKKYDANINKDNIGIPSGSNQAFCATLSSIASVS